MDNSTVVPQYACSTTVDDSNTSIIDTDYYTESNTANRTAKVKAVKTQILHSYTESDVKIMNSKWSALYGSEPESDTVEFRPKQDASNERVSVGGAVKRPPKASKNKRAKLLRNKKRRLDAGRSASSLKLIVEGKIHGVPVKGMLDNGSDISIVSSLLTQKHTKLFRNPKPSKFKLTTVDGSDLGDGTEFHDVSLMLGENDDFDDYYDFQSAELPQDVMFLLGIDWLADYKAEINHDPDAKNRIVLKDTGLDGDTKSYLKIVSNVNLADNSNFQSILKTERGTIAPQTVSCGMLKAATADVEGSKKAGVDTASSREYWPAQKQCHDPTVDDISIMSDRKFRKMRNRIEEKERKHSQLGGKLGVKGAVCMVVVLSALAFVATTCAIASYEDTPPTKAFIGLISSIATITT